eukprot:6370566-Prorocentrum_lima.AAC.1
MTSSLVGSEMCIRDRLKPVGGTNTGERETASKSTRVLAAHGGAVEGEACLLYTSDAADDM